MATYMNNIFNFGRDLPAPFDTLTSKKVSVSSKYGDKTTSTLCATMIKAIHAVINCMQATGEGAVGVIDQKTVAEYKSSTGPDAYHWLSMTVTKALLWPVSTIKARRYSRTMS